MCAPLYNENEYLIKKRERKIVKKGIIPLPFKERYIYINMAVYRVYNAV